MSKLTADTITDADIRAFKAEARAVDDRERVRACNAALGLPTGDGALGMLDQATCRARVAKLIIRERTPDTSAARVTAETITDEQIRELRSTTRDSRVINDCDEALWDEHIQSREITAARARCAEILNARAEGKS